MGKSMGETRENASVDCFFDANLKNILYNA